MITLDGYDLDFFDLICESQTNPMTPEFTNNTIAIPGKEEAYFFGTLIQPKPFEFTISTIQNDKIFLQEKLREFVSFLHDMFGKPRDLKLIFNYEQDKYYTVKLASKIDVERFILLGRMNIKFEAYDPRAYSIVNSNELTWGSEALNFESSYQLGQENSTGETTITGATIITEYVNGLAVKPIIEIGGSATGLVITNGDYSITFNDFVNSEWIIDCNKYTVIKNNANGFGSVDLRNFFLLPGTNNIQISGTSINITINIKYRDKFL